jgi:hypothetical protein
MKYTLFLVLSFYSVIGAAMSILDTGKVCTFSNISGIITIGGKPAINALVKREVSYGSGYRDETYTDKSGRFDLPALFTKTIAKFLPQEFVVGQKISVILDGAEYEIWEGVKRYPEENVEARGVPIVVECELERDKQLYMVDGQAFYTNCSWDVETDIVNTGF